MLHRSRQEINELISNHGFLPLFNPDDFEVCRQVVRAAYDGGVRLFECTNRSANAFAIFKQLVPFVLDTMPDLVLGAGTIMNAEAARQWYDAGAQFIVAPDTSSEVGQFCEKNGVFWCPGAGTLNEIIAAKNSGADLVKIFPANYIGGPGFVKAIVAPCPDLRLMPTGGVDGSDENLRAWFEAGVVCVGMGGQLFTKELLASKDYGAITAKAKNVVSAIQKIKSGVA